MPGGSSSMLDLTTSSTGRDPQRNFVLSGFSEQFGFGKHSLELNSNYGTFNYAPHAFGLVTPRVSLMQCSMKKNIACTNRQGFGKACHWNGWLFGHNSVSFTPQVSPIDQILKSWNMAQTWPKLFYCVFLFLLLALFQPYFSISQKVLT